ncbi:hypothetical protein GGR56DRAFT_363003 [Xylariaceae sp. FL0804]|nr:hypothetical protein GGR56DRAFT_363003 [Xylariaceae sp. FL0804]
MCQSSAVLLHLHISRAHCTPDTGIEPRSLCTGAYIICEVLASCLKKPPDPSISCSSLYCERRSCAPSVHSEAQYQTLRPSYSQISTPRITPLSWAMSARKDDFGEAVGRSIEGVKRATNAENSIIETAKQLLSSVCFDKEDIVQHGLAEWIGALEASDEGSGVLALHAAKVALLVTWLRYKGHSTHSTTAHTAEDLELVWKVLRGALVSPLYARAGVGRSHQGFLSLPFCRLARENGDNDEFWRFHIWLPSSPKPDPRLIIHSHQSFAQSWVLAGQAENTMWDVKITDDPGLATNAVYRLGAAFNKTLEPGCKEEASGTTIENTGRQVVVSEAHRERCQRNQSYLVPGADFHTTGVEENTVLATIFFFDASRGFFKDAGVPIGPLNGTEFTQYRNPEGARLEMLVAVVDAIRHWEVTTARAGKLAEQGSLHEASQLFGQAARAWDTDAQPFHDARDETEAQIFRGLDRYKDAALAMQQWAEKMGEGRREEARSACVPFKGFPGISMCLSMANA